MLVTEQKTLKRELVAWEGGGVPARGRNLAITSPVLWTVAIVTGRLSAYL